jgi:hypothetical protein
LASTIARTLDFRRLAEEAERRGTEILVEPISVDHFAPSGADLLKLHGLTGCSCTCTGFVAWPRRPRRALLLEHRGRRTAPEPDGGTPSAACGRRAPPLAPSCGPVCHRGSATAIVGPVVGCGLVAVEAPDGEPDAPVRQVARRLLAVGSWGASGASSRVPVEALRVGTQESGSVADPYIANCLRSEPDAAGERHRRSVGLST